MINNYLQILEETLRKKSAILTQLEAKSKEQSSMIIDTEATLAQIDKNMDEKAVLIKEMEGLDKGFDTLYDNIRKELLENKEQYKDEIKRIQTLIARIMEKSASIEAIEARNKAGMENRFKIERQELQRKKSASEAAYHYYKSANKLDFVDPQFMDSKK